MVDTRRLFKESCPLIEEFNVRNIMGGYEQKEWLFTYRYTTTTAADAITFSTLTGGILQKLDHSFILAQKLNASVTNKTFITSKGVNGFTLNGDASALYSIIVLGSAVPGAASANITQPQFKGTIGKWAKDYCPYCKAYNIKTLIGGVLADVVAFSFSWTTDNTADAIDFATATKVNDAYNQTGQGKANLVSQMYDTDYAIAITKADTGAVSTEVYPSSITKTGFTLNGENNKAYDVLIVGQIQY